MSEGSFVDLGDYDTEAMKDGDISNIMWLQMPKEHLFWYSKNLTGIKIGSSDVFSDGRSTNYNYGKNYQYPAIYDTGTSLIYVPESIAYELMYRIAVSKTHYMYKNFMVVECGERD